MERILGIDTGTNSLGWAIVEKEEGCTRLVAKGTNIFSEGVKIEKGIESSKAAERTEHRSVRKHYWLWFDVGIETYTTDDSRSSK